MLRRFKSARCLRSQRGFSLIELSIAMLIALFLLGGLVTLVMGTRRSSSTQSALAQLQDNQRIAMTLITNVVQKAGYFPNPVTQTLDTFNAETLSGVAMAQGQVIGGTYNAATSDTFGVRFYTPAPDTYNAVINCAGQSNATTATTIWYTNVFRVATVNGTSWLQCRTRTSGGGPTIPINLIPNVTKIQVLYGVGSSAGVNDDSVLQYLNASQMSVTTWPNVTVVKVTLTFQLPAYGSTGGQMANCATTPVCTTTLTRVIPVMSRGGVNT